MRFLCCLSNIYTASSNHHPIAIFAENQTPGHIQLKLFSDVALSLPVLFAASLIWQSCSSLVGSSLTVPFYFRMVAPSICRCRDCHKMTRWESGNIIADLGGDLTTAWWKSSCKLTLSVIQLKHPFRCFVLAMLSDKTDCLGQLRAFTLRLPFHWSSRDWSSQWPEVLMKCWWKWWAEHTHTWYFTIFSTGKFAP